MLCKVRVRLAWNVGRPDFTEAGPFRTENVCDEAWTICRPRIWAADRATAGNKVPKLVSIELYDFQTEESA